MNKIKQIKQKVGVIAIGGGGGNILESVLQDHPEYATMVVNADKQSLKQSAAAEKVLLTGFKPQQIIDSVLHEQSEIKAFMQERDVLIILSCLGGLTGSHALAPIVSLVETMKIHSLIMVTLPFQFEGGDRMEQAKQALDSVNSTAITVAVAENQKLIEIANKNTTMKESFQFVNIQVVGMIDKFLRRLT